jgi:hypothetical protein
MRAPVALLVLAAFVAAPLHAARADDEPATSATAPVVTAPPPAPAPEKKDDDDKVRLTVTADDDHVILERRANTVEGWQTTLGIPVFTATEQWEPVCAVPCTVQLSPHAAFRVNGRGIASSHEFLLPKGPDVKLEVSGRSSFWYGAGTGLTIVGGLLLAVGATSTLVAGNITSTDAETTLRGFGVTFLIAGAAMLVAGIPLILTGKSTVRSADGRVL